MVLIKSFAAKIRKLANTPVAAQGGYMVVNTEWGAFNNSASFRKRLLF